MAVLQHEPDGAVALSTGSMQVQEGLSTPETLNRLYGRTQALVEHLLLVAGLNHADVKVAMVEEPGGRRHNHTIMAQGIIMAALSGKGFAVVSYPVTSWKLQTVGNGHAEKEDVREYVRNSLGYDIEKEDENDSAAIAMCASMTASIKPPASKRRGARASRRRHPT